MTFQLYDLDNSGFVTKDEIIEVFCMTYEAKLKAIAASMHSLRDTANGKLNAISNYSKTSPPKLSFLCIVVDLEKLDKFVQHFRKVLTTFVESAFAKLDTDNDGMRNGNQITKRSTTHLSGKFCFRL